MDRIINRIVRLIRRGYSRGMIISEMLDDIDIFSKEKLFEIAKCRIRGKRKFGKLAEKLFFDEDGLRYSTPPEVAMYRAKRLRYETIADVSCGVGIQAIYFAMESERVIAVEKDPVRLKLAQFNAEAFGLDNIEFINGDATSKDVAESVKADVVFSDPSRKPEEPVRYLDTLNPSPIQIYEMYSRITNRIAFELPPQMSKENIVLDGEKEYISLNFRLNRLALYMGDLKSCDTSAVSIPSEEKVTDRDKRVEIKKETRPLLYLYEVDPALHKAELLKNLMGKLEFDGHALMVSRRRTLLTSDEVYESAFLRRYNILATCKFDVQSIKSTLKKLDVSKVTLRIDIDPKEYWSLRNEIERDLVGEKKIHLFRMGDRALIAERESS